MVLRSVSVTSTVIYSNHWRLFLGKRFTFIRLHQYIPFHLLGKLLNMCTMCPRLASDLAPHRARKAPAPLVPRVCLDNTLDRLLGDQVSALARIVQKRGDYGDATEEGDGTRSANILVTDNGLGNRVNEILGCGGLAQPGRGNESTFEVKGHFGRVVKGLGGANVVQHTGEIIRLGKVRPGGELFGEVLCHDDGPIDVHAVAVVDGLQRQMLGG